MFFFAQTILRAGHNGSLDVSQWLFKKNSFFLWMGQLSNFLYHLGAHFSLLTWSKGWELNRAIFLFLLYIYLFLLFCCRILRIDKVLVAQLVDYKNNEYRLKNNLICMHISNSYFNWLLTYAHNLDFQFIQNTFWSKFILSRFHYIFYTYMTHPVNLFHSGHFWKFIWVNGS